MVEFKIGDKIHVEFDGVVETEMNEEAPLVTYRVQGLNAGGVHWIYLTKDNATKLEPADWPPQAGDIWETAGHEWFVYINSWNALVIRSFDGYQSGFYGNFDAFKALNPRLVRRRGREAE